MRRARPEELSHSAELALVAHLTLEELERLIPVELSDLGPLAAAEPARGALIELDGGELVVVEYGLITGTLTVSIPMRGSRDSALAAFLDEVPLAPEAITWTAARLPALPAMRH